MAELLLGRCRMADDRRRVYERHFLVGYVEVERFLGYVGQSENLDTAYPAEPLLENAFGAVFVVVHHLSGLSVGPICLMRTLDGKNWKAWEAGFESDMFHNRLHVEGFIIKRIRKTCWPKGPRFSIQD